MPTITLPGGPALYYQEWGRPDGAVVLLLHGFGSSSDSWRNVGPALGQRFRVIAPDARGHARSGRTQDYPFDAWVDDVTGLLEQLGVIAAIVVGHETGALVAYKLAATHPEAVRMLVLEEINPPDPSDRPMGFPREPYDDDHVDWRAEIALARWRNNPPKGWAELAEKISSKTLVLGAADSPLPQPRIAELSRRIPNATFTSVPGGHDFHERTPSVFLREVEPFLAFFAK